MVYKVGFLEKIFGENFPKVVTEYYESGQKKTEGTVIGKQSRGIYTKDGLWTYWYQNGKKEKEETYKNGKKREERTYKNGEKDGLETLWHKNGQKESEGTFKDGKKDGLWTYWYNYRSYDLDKGRQKKEERTYKVGKRVGKSVTYWYKTGKKKYEGTYKNGKKDGLWTFWYVNGKKEKEETYKNGKVYHKGVEDPELKGTLPPTKPKKIKPSSKRENKLIIGGKNITAERLKCALGSCYLKLMQDLLVQSGGWIVTDGFINKDFIIKSEAFSDLELKTKSELRNTAKTLGLIELANDYKTLKIQKERIVQILDSYKTKSFKKVPDPKSYSYNFYFLTYLGRVGQLRRGNDFPLIGNTVSIKNAKSAIATLHPIEIFGYRFLLEAILEQIIMDGVDGMGRIDGF